MDYKKIAIRAVEVYKDEGVISLILSSYSTIHRIIFNSNIFYKFRLFILEKKGYQTTDCSPTKLIYVSPDKIQNFTGTVKDGRVVSKSFVPIKTFGLVYEGEWDTGNPHINSLNIYKAIEERYVNDQPWVNSEWYQQVVKKINKNPGEYYAGSKKEFQNKLKKIDELIDSIEKSGYKSQSELGTAKHTHEIKINIGRDGELLWNGGGRHRLCIAKIMGIEEVPVLVKIRHKQWQNIRDEIRSESSFDRLSKEAKRHIKDGHPDLQDLL